MGSLGGLVSTKRPCPRPRLPNSYVAVSGVVLLASKPFECGSVMTSRSLAVMRLMTFMAR